MEKGAFRIYVDLDIYRSLEPTQVIFVFFRNKKLMVKRRHPVYSCCSTQEHNFIGGGSYDA